MGLTITRNFGRLDHLELVTKDDMKQIGLLARERIVRRTLRGIDAAGLPFRAYAARYAKQKAAALGAGPVNLQVSGAMLDDLTIVDVGGWPDPFVELGWTK